MTEGGVERTRVLLIGYGNPLRWDDGLGPFIVDTLALGHHTGIEKLTPLQLLPELAANLAECKIALFVDARMGPPEVKVERLEEPGAVKWSTHRADPCSLLALTRAVYGRAPQGWWITVPGVDFGFGEGLSPTAREHADRARNHIQALLREVGVISFRSLPGERGG